MNLFPLWQILLNRSVDDLEIFKFNYTYDTKYHNNGDIYTTILYDGILATYILDFDFERLYGRTYDITYMLKSKYPICEVIKFDRGELYKGVKDVLVFNKSSNIYTTFYDHKSRKHNVIGPSAFDMKQDMYGKIIMYNKEYHIHGKQYSKELFHRFVKLNKIKQNSKICI